MKLRKPVRHIIILVVLILLLHLFIFLGWAEHYHRFLFVPLQYLRSHVFALLPFSVGDILYVAAALFLVFRFLRFMVQFIRQADRWSRAGIQLLYGLRSLLMIYFLILAGWGGNYYRTELPQKLQLADNSTITAADLIAFDSVLTERLNNYSSAWQQPEWKTLNHKIVQTYETGTVTSCKASLFGNGIAYAGIEGYFNPFTGEAQINAGIPGYMQPFVIAHELAHQTGTAAEDDANLQAYIHCVTSKDSILCYSAYLNIWLYTHRRVRMLDSAVAGHFKRKLNALTIAQIDTLRMLRQRFNSSAGDYSSMLYDAYLKLGNQEMGIESYHNVAFTALCWERKYFRN